MSARGLAESVCSIRDVLPDEAAALIALRQAVFAETPFMLYEPGEYSASPDDVSGQLQRIRASGHSRSLVAQVDRRMLGFLGVNGSAMRRMRHAASLYLGVLQAHWGRGIGAGLLTEAIRWAPSAGLSRLELYVMKHNDRAFALYRRLGFRVEGERRRAYMIDGLPVDDVLMAYVFDT